MPCAPAILLAKAEKLARLFSISIPIDETVIKTSNNAPERLSTDNAFSRAADDRRTAAADRSRLFQYPLKGWRDDHDATICGFGVLRFTTGVTYPRGLIDLEGSCPWEDPWVLSYGAHLHCRFPGSISPSDVVVATYLAGARGKFAGGVIAATRLDPPFCCRASTSPDWPSCPSPPQET